jgi:hypothetical protein
MARQAFVCDLAYLSPLYAELVRLPAQAHPLDISHQYFRIACRSAVIPAGRVDNLLLQVPKSTHQHIFAP